MDNPAYIADQFGRVHDYLRISLTERCNLRCTYCMPAEGTLLTEKSKLMSREEVLEMASVFVSMGVKKIRLTGGEPLVRNDAAEIIESLSRFPVQLAITTNGILIDKYVNIFKQTGLRSINVSLDTLRKEKFNSITRRDYFEKVISNIDLLLAENFRVKVNLVLMKGTNDDEVLDFIEWTSDKDVHIRFIEFMPFDGNRWDWSKGLSYQELMNIIFLEYGDDVTRLTDQKNDTAKNYRIYGYKGTFAIISSVTNPFCDSCNRLRLTADGKLKNCLFSSGETDLLTPMRNGTDIKPLIRDAVWHKKASRGGMDTFEKFSTPALNRNNRSMVMIGG